jgi:phosphoenolpyruvate carboxykinase (ATP)
MDHGSSIKGGGVPTLPSLAEDYIYQQVQKQQQGNFHSTSLTSSVTTMVVNAVNKTGLHPAGVQ